MPLRDSLIPKLLVVATLACATPLVSPAAAGPSGFRCVDTGRVISVGDSQYEVRRKCGDPDDATSHVEYRTVREKVRKWKNGVMVEEDAERTVEVVIDDWIYDFGRARFIQHLRFEQSRLVLVSDGDRGFND
jgi:Ni/Co efflux regulator RcnB